MHRHNARPASRFASFFAALSLSILAALSGVSQAQQVINGGNISPNTVTGDKIAPGAITDDKASLANKPSVGLVATTNLTLSGVQTIDGVTGVAGTTLVLATAQTNGAQNGPWLMQSGAWTRPTWYASGSTTQAAQFIEIKARLGTTWQNTTWRQTAAAPITIDTTPTTWLVTPYSLNASTATGDVSTITTTATGSTTARTLASRAAERLNLKDYGAVQDYIALNGCSITSGTTALNCPAANFTAADAAPPAKIVIVPGAGAAGAPLTANISSVTDSKNVVLSVAASTTVSLAPSNYGHDDSAAWNAIITKFNSLTSAGTQSCIEVPPGISLIATAASIPTFQKAQCVQGYGFNTSVIVVAPTFNQSALFNVSEAWGGSSYPTQGPSVVYPSVARTGPVFTGIGVIGWTNGNAFDAYVTSNRDDNVVMSDVQFSYIPGRAIFLGRLDTTAFPAATLAYTRESEFYNVRVVGCGLLTAPSVEITGYGTGTGDSTNQIQFYGMNIIFPQSAGLVVRNQQTAKGIGNLRFVGLRVEGSPSPSPAIFGDLIQIGDTDPTYSGGINNIQFYGLILNLPYNGYAGMKFQQPAGVSAAQPYNIDVFGTMTSSNTGGLGINIQSGRLLRFYMDDIASSGTAFTLGSTAAGVGTGIWLDMNGRETSLTYNIDSTSGRVLNRPVYATGQPSSQANEGNQNTNTFCPSFNSSCSQNGASALGGQGITSDGQFSIGIGLQASALTRYGIFSQASGQFASPGDAQITTSVLRGSGTSASPIRLTTNNAAASNAAGSANIWNIGTNKTFGGTLTVVCRNVTTTGNDTLAQWNGVMLSRDAGSPVLTLSSATTPDVSRTRGTAGFTWSVTADTTNNGINVTATPPNTDTWRCSMRISDVEVGG